jgi:hypothetical protein
MLREIVSAFGLWQSLDRDYVAIIAPRIGPASLVSPTTSL